MHELSVPAYVDALEVLEASGLEVIVVDKTEYPSIDFAGDRLANTHTA